MALATAAEAALTKALSLAPKQCLGAYGFGLLSQLYTNRATQGIAECERALALNEIWPPPKDLSVSASISSVAPRKPKAHVQEALAP